MIAPPKPDDVKSLTSERLGRVALQILSYLRAHSDAQDTVEGIAEWWLSEQHIRRVIEEVRQALKELMAHGIVQKHLGAGGQVRYGLNRHKGVAIEQNLNPTTSKHRQAQPPIVRRKKARPNKK